MKRKIVLALFIALALIATVAFSSCMEGIVIPGVTDTPQNGGNSSTGGDNGGSNTGGNNSGGSNTGGNEGGGNTTVKNTVTFYYNNEAIHTVELESGEKLDKASVEAELSKKDMTFNGYFEEYTLKTKFDFSKEISSSISVYCRNSYVVNYYYGDDIILVQHVDKVNNFFTQEMLDQKDALRAGAEKFTGIYTTPDADIDPKEIGDTSPVAVQFDFSDDVFEDVNLYCKRFATVVYKFGNETAFRQYVDTYEGFSTKQIEKKDNFLYNGYHFSGYYSDNTLKTPFDFSNIPTDDVTLYCARDITKAGKNVSWEIIENEVDDTATLVFNGSGDMYAFGMLEEVPWRSYYLAINKVIIPEGITSIADYAFCDCSNLTSIQLPESLVRIGAHSFNKSSISDINFPDALRIIGEFAFNECTALTDLKFNAGLEIIADGAFYKCTNITTAVLTDTIISFGTSAFQECKALTSAYYIGTEEQYSNVRVALDNYWIKELAHTYYITDADAKPVTPGPYWYYDDEGNICQWYYSIWYLESDKHRIPFKVDYVDADGGITQDNIDFCNAIVHKGYKFVGWKLVGTTDNYELEAGDKLTADIKLVGDRGKKCGDNVQWEWITSGVNMRSIRISKIDTSLEDGAMWDFESAQDAPWLDQYKSRIEKVIIEDGITHIGSFVFVEYKNSETPYKNFSSVFIPDSVTSIHTNAFSGCDHLIYIYYEGDAAAAEQVDGLYELNFESTSASTTVYTNATGKDFATLGSGAYWIEDSNGVKVAWIFDSENKSLVIGGGDKNHNLTSWESVEDTPWYSFAAGVESVFVSDNVTSIGNNTFYGMASVKNIILGERISAVAASALVGTDYYTKQYQSGVVYVYTHDGSTSDIRYAHLIKVNPDMVNSSTFIIPEKTISIAENAFDGCVFTRLVLPKDVRSQNIYYSDEVGEGLRTAFGSMSGFEVYFDGLEETWADYSMSVSAVKVYFYSENAPVMDKSDFWHWSTDKSEPIIWE